MADIEITTDAARVEAAIKKAGTELQASFAGVILGAAQILAGEMRRQVVALNTKDPTGELAQSMRGQLLVKNGTEVGAIAGSDKPHARTQDRGNQNHKSASGKLLAIPNRLKVSRGKSPSDLSEKLVFVKKRDGTKLLIKPKKRGFDLMFVLKESVNIPGTHYAKAAAATGGPMVEEHIEESIHDILEKARKP